MSDDRTWYSRDPQSEPPEDGRRGRRDRGDQGAYGSDPYGQDPYRRQQPPPNQGRGGGGYHRDGEDPYRPEQPQGGQPPRDPYEPNQRPWSAPSGRPGPAQGGRGYGGQGSQPPGQGGGDAWRPGQGQGQGPDPWQPGYDDPAGYRGRPGGAGGPGGRGGRDGSRPEEEYDSMARRGRGRAGADGLAATAVNGRINHDLDLNELDPSGKARAAMNGGKAKKRSRSRTATKWVAISVGFVLVLGAAGFYYVYASTIGSLKHTPLTPGNVHQSALPTDPYGNTAMNILLLGSDTRDTASDCTLGGDCQGSAAGANADGELVLHVSADRTNATVMSIPRDTLTNVPHCTTDNSGAVNVTGHFQGTINSALQFGPECQVAAVNALTGITITGYIMFDFSGVVSMSNALGGVPVCVTKAVHDKNSGLQLPAGTSTVEGNTALEFLRTRDSFFDGSDLGREQTTHYFFTQMLQTVRTKLNLSNVSTLLGLAQAASHSTTVSDNFTGLSNLEGLMTALNKVPNKAITFVTMPWTLDPTNNARVQVDQPAAGQMFTNIQNDVSYSGATKPSATTAPTTPSLPTGPAGLNKSQVSVNVVNGNGVGGRASTVATALNSAGFTRAVPDGDASSTAAQTVVYYPSGDQGEADGVAAALQIPATQVQQSSQYAKVTVVIGTDFESGSSYSAAAAPSAGSSGAAPSGGAAAPAESYETNADSTGECIPVESGNLKIAHQ
ncbi:MAG TPA: LCP family protein [Actinocrinis sp.]|nr:LCP family protein [Actinocrinis sp.]